MQDSQMGKAKENAWVEGARELRAYTVKNIGCKRCRSNAPGGTITPQDVSNFMGVILVYGVYCSHPRQGV